MVESLHSKKREPLPLLAYMNLQICGSHLHHSPTRIGCGLGFALRFSPPDSSLLVLGWPSFVSTWESELNPRRMECVHSFKTPKKGAFPASTQNELLVFTALRHQKSGMAPKKVLAGQVPRMAKGQAQPPKRYRGLNSQWNCFLPRSHFLMLTPD